MYVYLSIDLEENVSIIVDDYVIKHHCLAIKRLPYGSGDQNRYHARTGP